MVEQILHFIGHTFHPDRSSTDAAKTRWAQDRNFYRQNLITWSAHWLDSRGVSLKPERFQKEICDKLLEVKLHINSRPQPSTLNPQPIKNWPRFLTHCIQDHFKHNGERLYEEAKALRNQVDAALDKALARGQPAEPAALDPIRVLALAHQVNKPKPKKLAKPDNQPTLFEL